MIGDMSSLNARLEMSELREHIPPGKVRVLMGFIHEGQPFVSLFGDFPDQAAANAAAHETSTAGAIYQGYDQHGELVLELSH